MYFFAKRTQNVCLFWPFLANFCCFVVNLCFFWYTFYRPSVVVYLNWQISGMQKYQIFFKTETNLKKIYNDSQNQVCHDHPDKCPRDHEWSQRLFSWPGHHRPSPSHASSTSASQLKCIFPNSVLGFPEMSNCSHPSCKNVEQIKTSWPFPSHAWSTSATESQRKIFRTKYAGVIENKVIMLLRKERFLDRTFFWIQSSERKRNN